MAERMRYYIETSFPTPHRPGGYTFKTIARFLNQSEGEVALRALQGAFPDDTMRMYANDGLLVAE